jgi:hypothetical protein
VTKVPEKKEERLKTIEEKLNALSQQLSKMQTKLENDGK